jgi:endonuclease G, mitochondrial
MYYFWELLISVQNSNQMEQAKRPRRPKKTPETFADRKGYDENFITAKDFTIKLDELLKNHLSGLTPLLEPAGKNTHYLQYHHFSVAMNKARKMPQLTAVNIDGSAAIDFGRDSDSWHFDPRISREDQVPHEVYKGNDLDLGHLVRRLDPVWGEEGIAKAANFDTFHLTVCAPQHKDLNRVTWLSLEDYILNNANCLNFKASVFTGPIFSNDDIPYDGVLLPLAFWKIAAMIKKDGTPSVSGYILSQAEMIDGMANSRGLDDTGFGEFKTYQVPLSKIAEKTGLQLESFYKFDPTNKVGTRGLDDGSPKFEISGADSIFL